jgi:outer membrane biosynthesis protein TonB
MTLKTIASLVALAGVVSGCAAAQAKAPADRPTLEVPIAPPRVVERTVRELPPPEPVSELPPPPVVASRPRPQPPVREAAKPDPPKPAEAIVEPQQSQAAAPAPVPPILRTPGTADSAVVTRQISDILERAKKTLASINYQRLTTDRRAEYENAKLMITECEQALKASKYEYAQGVADKVDRLTKGLQSR